MDVRVQEAPFDLGGETRAFSARQTRSGAVVTFTGIVRDTDAGLEGMEIEHYPGMTESQLQKFSQGAQDRFSLEDVLVIHRYGHLVPGEMIMMVATSARHRADAFAGAEYLMDYLKSRAPFWKREITQDGSTEWVAAKSSDERALERW